MTTISHEQVGRRVGTPSRDAVIEEASGILMQRHDSSVQQATALLSHMADYLGVRRTDLARLIVDSTPGWS